MSEDVNFLEWAFKGSVGVILTVGAGMWTWLINKVGKIQDSHIDHQLYVERTFAKTEVVNDNFDKLHGCIDDMQKNMQTMSVSQATLASNMANMASNLQNFTSSILRSPHGP